MALCCSLYVFYIYIMFEAMENQPLPERVSDAGIWVGAIPSISIGWVMNGLREALREGPGNIGR